MINQKAIVHFERRIPSCQDVNLRLVDEMGDGDLLSLQLIPEENLPMNTKTIRALKSLAKAVCDAINSQISPVDGDSKIDISVGEEGNGDSFDPEWDPSVKRIDIPVVIEVHCHPSEKKKFLEKGRGLLTGWIDQAVLASAVDVAGGRIVDPQTREL
jgi:hypothetical protein